MPWLKCALVHRVLYMAVRVGVGVGGCAGRKQMSLGSMAVLSVWAQDATGRHHGDWGARFGEGDGWMMRRETDGG